MKYFLPVVVFCLLSGYAISQPAFTTGNLAVYRIGEGDDTLSSAPFPVFVDEFTITGVFVRSHPLPTAINGNNKRIVASGSATSEGQITRTTDKRFLLVTGYDTFPAPLRLSISSSTSDVIKRVVGIIGSDGVIDATTGLSNSYSANNFRGACSNDGINLWLAGTGSPSTTAGVRYAVKGADTSTQLSTSVTNIRAVNIYNGKLYCSSGSGAFKAISQVGTGLPNSSGQPIAVLPGFPNVSGVPNDPYAFSISPDGLSIYLADNRSKANGGGVQKWRFDGTNWNLAYTLDSGLTTGLRNILVDWARSPFPIIYATTGEGLTANMQGNKLVAVTDFDSTSAFIALATAGVNTVFRGIAFAPEPGAAGTVYTFTGNGNWNVAANWANTAIPPNPLPAGSSIIINNTTPGSCILNIAQSASPGSTFTVSPGKNLIVQGSLTMQ